MNRRGIALVAALSLLSLLGLLIVGAVTTTVITQRAARASLYDAPLAAAADYAIGEALADPDARGLAALPFSQPRTFALASPAADGIRVAVTITRLHSSMLWIVADSWATADSALHRRVGTVASFPIAGAAPSAPLVAAGSTTLGGDVALFGDSTATADCAATFTAPSIQTSDSTALFTRAASRAELDSASGVRHVRGDTTISTGSFDGILVVDGMLAVEGPFHLTGLAIVRDSIRSSAGLQVEGALIAQTGRIVLSGATVTYSPCTVERVLRGAAPPRTVRGRGWADLF